jgi:hypothetical protein
MFYNLNQFPTKNIEYICKLDIKNLQNACHDYVRRSKTTKPNSDNNYNDVLCSFVDFNPTESKVTYSFNNDIYNYLYRQDLRIYLGIYKDYLKCLMHQDKENQASLYQKDDGVWVYKCFDFSCPFKIGDINKLTECLTGLNRPAALEFLMEVYGVILQKNEYQIKQEKVLDANIELLLDVEKLQQNYPELYKRIKLYIPQLLILHEFAKRNLTLEQAINSDLVTFTAPVRQLSQSLIEQNKSGDLNQITKRNNILTFIGLLLKLSDDMILPNELQRLKDYALNLGYNNYLNYYALPSYNYNVLNKAESKSIEFKESAMTVRGFSSEMLSRGFGDNEVHNVFPRQENKSLNGLHDKVIEIITKKILFEIKNKGCCIEKQIYGNGYFIKSIKNKTKVLDPSIINKQTIETIFKICLPELINKYDFKRGRLSNELKEKFNIKNIKGMPMILYKDISY